MTTSSTTPKSASTTPKSPSSKTTPRSEAEDIHIGLTADTRRAVVATLSGILADQHVLYIKTRNFHWNLRGGRFHTLHAFYEEQYNALAAAIDETAERVRMLGLPSSGSMREFLDLATLSEEPGRLVSGETTLALLAADHEACARTLREAIEEMDETLGDAGTADFLTGLLQQHEKTAWMLRSFLE